MTRNSERRILKQFCSSRTLLDPDDEFVIGTRQKRIKVIERVGPTLESLLCKASPWKFAGCNRESCFPCQHGGGSGGECDSEGVTYSISCLECKKEGRIVEYIGETARTIYDRGNEHLSNLIGKKKGKPLWEHIH